MTVIIYTNKQKNIRFLKKQNVYVSHHPIATSMGWKTNLQTPSESQGIYRFHFNWKRSLDFESIITSNKSTSMFSCTTPPVKIKNCSAIYVYLALWTNYTKMNSGVLDIGDIALRINRTWFKLYSLNFPEDSKNN